MRKLWALEQLGGSVTTAAAACRVSASAVTQWPDELPDRIADRVLAAIARKHLPPELTGADPDAANCGAVDAERNVV
jgi:hypothetical protein